MQVSGCTGEMLSERPGEVEGHRCAGSAGTAGVPLRVARTCQMLYLETRQGQKGLLVRKREREQNVQCETTETFHPRAGAGVTLSLPLTPSSFPSSRTSSPGQPALVRCEEICS